MYCPEEQLKAKFGVVEWHFCYISINVRLGVQNPVEYNLYYLCICRHVSELARLLPWSKPSLRGARKEGRGRAWRLVATPGTVEVARCGSACVEPERDLGGRL